MCRRKAFGLPAHALDRNKKHALWVRARALVHRSQKGRHYGELTAKHLEVFRVLIFEFHNAKSGLCFPSYEAIMEKAHCCRQTVADALRAFERLKLLEVVNRLLRVRWFDQEASQRRTRVMRTSNCYVLAGSLGQAPKARPESSKSEFQTGTEIPSSSNPLEEALARLRKGIGAPSAPIAGASTG